MGDSPEIMPLDNSLFNDLVEAIGKHVCATWNEKGEGKYSMGTPDEAWSTMMRVWNSVAISSERIIADIDWIEFAMDEIEKVSSDYCRRR